MSDEDEPAPWKCWPSSGRTPNPTGRSVSPASGTWVRFSSRFCTWSRIDLARFLLLLLQLLGGVVELLLDVLIDVAQAACRFSLAALSGSFSWMTLLIWS